MSIKLKFLIIFLTISTIPILIITGFTYDRYTKLVKEQMEQVSDTIFEKAQTESNGILEEIQNISMTFNFYSSDTESIIDTLKKFKEGGSGYTPYDIMESNRTISFMCRNFIFSHNYINGIFIFTPTGPVLGYSTSKDIRSDYSPQGHSWYENTLKKDGKLYVDGITQKNFIINAQPSISFSQALYDVYTHEFLGILYIDCKPDLFDISDVNTLPDMTLLAIESDNGGILYSNINEIKTEINTSNSLIRKADLSLPGLKLIYSVNYDALYEEFGFTRIVILAIAFICFLIFAVISIFLSHSVTKPMIHLSRKMAIRDGTQPQPTTRYLNRTDEIGVLYNEYNHMVEVLSSYIKNEFQNKLITLDSQMKSLEAQINSHFLFNTLESINSIAELEEVESISIMSMALGDMFRYSIKTVSELVTVQEELKHVRDYVSIMQIRFENRFQLVQDIPETLHSCRVLKLILQPLVENAFYHGLNYCRYGDLITLKGWIEENYLYLSVSDNGIGMSLNQVRELDAKLKEPAQFTELGHRNKQSIGIKNIHTRIVLYYGDGYGIQITSQPKEGTTMTIKLPYLQNE